MTIIQRQKTEAAVDRIVNKLVHQFIKNFHNVAQTHGPDEAADMIEAIIRYEDR
jgi:glutamyl-tRNA reductase